MVTEVEVDIMDEAIMTALRASADKILTKLPAPGTPDCVWSFRELLWPAWDTTTEPSLVLVPLDRIGAVQGHSGNRVMIGYFIDRKPTSPCFPSKPMIVKNYTHEGTGEHKLEQEERNGNSVKRFVAYNKDAFAFPIHFDKIGKYSFLWSPFASSKWALETVLASRSKRLSLGSNDFLRILREREDITELESIIDNVFHLLMPLHLSNGAASAKEVNIVEHYQDYLRNLDTAAGWAETWARRIWGLETEQKVKDFDREWTNPFWVLEQLRSIPNLRLRCGAIHGDLHPRNIVITDMNTPHVIDFGWSGEDSHIAKDFTLFECNLRFVVLKTAICFDDLVQLARWLPFDAGAPALKSRYATRTADLIKNLRENAKRNFQDTLDWNVEYILPMFLVALGLMKHVQEFDNQISARLTVLSLADYVAEHILPIVNK